MNDERIRLILRAMVDNNTYIAVETGFIPVIAFVGKPKITLAEKQFLERQGYIFESKRNGLVLADYGITARGRAFVKAAPPRR